MSLFSICGTYSGLWVSAVLKYQRHLPELAPPLDFHSLCPPPSSLSVRLFTHKVKRSVVTKISPGTINLINYFLRAPPHPTHPPRPFRLPPLHFRAGGIHSGLKAVCAVISVAACRYYSSNAEPRVPSCREPVTSIHRRNRSALPILANSTVF